MADAITTHGMSVPAPGMLSPGLLAVLETFSVSVIVIPAGTPIQIVTRNPLRTGITISTGPAIADAVGILPRYPLPTEVSALGLQNGPILITMDLYRSAVMSEWWAYSPGGTSITVYEFTRI